MRTYRCFYAPTAPWGSLALGESGVVPFVQVTASSAEEALRAAHRTTGCPITEAERLDDPAV